MKNIINLAYISFLFIAFSHVYATQTDSHEGFKSFKQTYKPHQKKVVSYDDYKLHKIQWKSGLPIYQTFVSGKLQTHKMHCISKFSQALTPELLGQVKGILGSSSTDRLPNGAMYNLKLHLFVPGLNEYVLDFPCKSIFISGGRYFDENAADVIKKYNLKIASQNFLTKEQYKEYLRRRNNDSKPSADPTEASGIYLGKIMEANLRNEVIKGGWKNNALDSEALVLLYISRNLKKMFEFIESDAKDRLMEKYSEKYQNYKPEIKKISINRLVLGISSYYKPCHLCRNLIQGFLFRFRELAEKVGNECDSNFKVKDDFGSLALTYGQTESRNADLSGIKDKAPVLKKSWPQIQMGYHQYVECVLDKPVQKSK